MPHSLTHPERLTITGPQGETYQGGDQEWYRDLWQRRAGCGPTTAAALLSYLSQTRPGLRPMVPAAARTQAGFLRYMEALWPYVTPGARGLDKDCPVAFLNFSHGALKNLDSWHWVPLTAMTEGESVLLCTILDEGEARVIDLALWWETSSLGGALVGLFPDMESDQTDG